MTDQPRIDSDVPEADALEQERAWKDESDEPETPNVDFDVPEADALEQAQPVPGEEDEDYR